ncbi:Alpha/Beta hydrolase protein [Trichoderma sp. SZMC 28015]
MLADLTNEKQPLTEEGMLPIDSTPRQQSAKNQRMTQKWLLLATILSILLVWDQLAPYDSNTAHNCQAPQHVRTYPGELIEWTLCGNLEGSDLECSSITVPMDQFSKENSGNRTFSIPLARLRGSQKATKNIIVNPGGPGGSGINWLYRRGKATQKIAGDNFHILSFDPRGVNNSRPQATCFPDDETRKARSISLSYDPLADGPKLQPWTSNFVQACSDTMGEYGPYMNTPQTAADMNSILDAVGQENMIYWGFSYGSLLGQTYATLFPERSERVIIDGVVNQFYWYTDPLEGDFEDTEKVLDGLFNECVKASDDCPLNAFGHTKEDLKQNVTKFLQSLKEDPIPAYINKTAYGLIDYSTMWLRGIFPALYRPSSWYELADTIAQLMSGNATAALLAFGLDKNSSMVMEHGMIIHSNDGAAGKSHWPEKKYELLEMLQPMWNSSSFAVTQMEEFFTKAQWLIPKEHSFAPRRGVETLHPLLILSTTYDPICPLRSAKVARESFVGSRLIEIEGYGHCSSAMPSSCIVPHLRAFLNNGTMPERDVKCGVDGPYFITPDQKEEILAGRLGSEEGELLAAQYELAGPGELANWL